MGRPNRRTSHRWRGKVLVALFAATAALAAGTQALAPSPAAAVMQDGEECSDFMSFLDCEESNGGGGYGGGSGGGGSTDPCAGAPDYGECYEEKHKEEIEELSQEIEEDTEEERERERAYDVKVAEEGLRREEIQEEEKQQAAQAYVEYLRNQTEEERIAAAAAAWEAENAKEKKACLGILALVEQQNRSGNRAEAMETLEVFNQCVKTHLQEVERRGPRPEKNNFQPRISPHLPWKGQNSASRKSSGSRKHRPAKQHGDPAYH